jgi:hypothetical protein
MNIGNCDAEKRVVCAKKKNKHWSYHGTSLARLFRVIFQHALPKRVSRVNQRSDGGFD